jgi:hypothetical protein
MHAIKLGNYIAPEFDAPDNPATALVAAGRIFFFSGSSQLGKFSARKITNGNNKLERIW